MCTWVCGKYLSINRRDRNKGGLPEQLTVGKPKGKAGSPLRRSNLHFHCRLVLRHLSMRLGDDAEKKSTECFGSVLSLFPLRFSLLK